MPKFYVNSVIVLLAFLVSGLNSSTAASNSPTLLWQTGFGGSLGPVRCIDARDQQCHWDVRTGWRGGTAPRRGIARMEGYQARAGRALQLRPPRARCSGHLSYDYGFMSDNGVRRTTWWGLSINSDRNSDSRYYFGVPARPGMFTERLVVYNVVCDGQEFDGFEQRIHFYVAPAE